MLRPAVCALLLDLLDPDPTPPRRISARAPWLPTVTVRLTLAPATLAPLRGAQDADAIAPGTTLELWLTWPLAPSHDDPEDP